MKISVFKFFALAIVASALPLYAAQPKDPRPVVKIGIILSTTGNIAHIGENMLLWQKHAQADLAKKPTKYRYQFFIEDDQFLPKYTSLAAQRLINLNGVNILMSANSAPGLAASAISESKKIPHFAMAYDPRVVAGKYSFSYATTAKEHIPAFLKLLEKRKYKKLALIAVLSPTWKPAIDALHKASQAGAFEITYEKIYQPGERDFRLGLQFMPQDVDAVVLLSWDPEVSIIGKQYREAGQTKPIIGMCGGILMSSSERERFDGAVDVYYCDIQKGEALNKEWTGKPLPSGNGPSLYDEIMLIAEHCEALYTPKGAPSAEALVKSLRDKPDYTGMIGSVHLGEDNYFHSPINYYKIEGKDFKLLPLESL